MAIFKDLSSTGVEKVKDVSGKTKDLAQSTYSNVQDNVQTGLSRSQKALLVGLGLAQGLLKYNQKKAEKNIKHIEKKSKRGQKDLNENLLLRWAKAQAAVGLGLSLAQELLSKQSKDTRKGLKKAQKRFGKMQDSWLDNFDSGWSRTQDSLTKGSKQAAKSVARTATSAVSMKEAMQDQYKRYQRKRARARSLFRWGLIVGFVLTLLYAPKPGAEMRQKLMGKIQQYRTSLGI